MLHAAHRGLSPALHAAIAAALPDWSKGALTYAVVMDSDGEGFCEGWDFAWLAKLAQEDQAAARRVLAQAYTLSWQLDCFTKPMVPLIDGVAMGAGAGLGLYGTHSVAGERYRFSLPGPALGWIPDAGLSHVLARMPARMGLYLALSGRMIGQADAFHLSLITHCIPAARFSDISAALSEAEPVDPLLDDLHVPQAKGALADVADAVARCFAADTIEGIVARLGEERGATAQWARDLMRLFETASPLALKITQKLVREAGALDLREALIQEYRVASRLVTSAEFATGARAAAAGARPLWPSGKLADIGDDEVGAYFEPLGKDELELSTRVAMQAAAL